MDFCVGCITDDRPNTWVCQTCMQSANGNMEVAQRCVQCSKDLSGQEYGCTQCLGFYKIGTQEDVDRCLTCLYDNASNPGELYNCYAAVAGRRAFL